MKRATQQIVFALTAALLSFSLPALAGPDRRQDPAAAALIHRAIALSDIQAHGAPAFRLRALLRVRYANGKSEEGQLLQIWTPAGMWHYEQSLAGYHSVEVTSGKEVWVASNLRYVPFPMFLAERALGLPGALRAARGRGLDEPFASAGNGEQCVRTADGSHSIKYCFDPENGELRKLVDSLWNVTYEYSKYESFGEKKFPREMRILRSSGSVFIDIRVDQLVPAESLDLRAFLPVKGAKEHPLAARCGVIERPKLEKMVKPEYPAEAEKAGLTGVVRLYAEIGADGIPRGMWPINASPPILRQVAIEAVRQWRYRPQTCKVTGAKMPLVAPITVLFVSH
jgi:hypothetical protein